MPHSPIRTHWEAVLMGRTAARGTRPCRSKHRARRLHFTSRESCKRSIGATKKHSSSSTSWQTSEVNFTTFVKIPGSESVWLRTATPLPSSWRGSLLTEGRLVLSTRASATRAVPVLRVFGRPWSTTFGKDPEYQSHSLMHSLRRISECAPSPARSPQLIACFRPGLE